MPPHTGDGRTPIGLPNQEGAHLGLCWEGIGDLASGGYLISAERAIAVRKASRSGRNMVTGNRTAVGIEDEPDIREVIGYNLARKGFSVLTAADGS